MLSSMIHTHDSHNPYRDAMKFQQLLQNLQSSNHHVNDDDDDRNHMNLSKIVFLNDPSSNNDIAAGLLGQALQVQIQNYTNAMSTTNNNSTASLNQVVQHLYITIQQLCTNYEIYISLLQYISLSCSSTKLISITLDGYGDHVPPTVSSPVITQFLLHIQQNTTLQTLVLYGCYNIDISIWKIFLLNCSIQNFIIDCTTFISYSNVHHNNDHNDTATMTVPSNHRILLRQEAALAFQYNTSIQRLYLEINDETLQNVQEILQYLSYNTSIRHLQMEWAPPFNSIIRRNDDDYDDNNNNNISVLTTRATYYVDTITIQRLVSYITHTSSLRHLEFIELEFHLPPNSMIECIDHKEDIKQRCDPKDDTYDTMKPILQALNSNPDIISISFQQCRWDEYNFHVFCLYLAQVRYIQNIQIHFCIPDQKFRNHNYRIIQFIRKVLQYNGYIRYVHIQPYHRRTGITRRMRRTIQTYMQRNIGIQQFLRQYVHDNTNYHHHQHHDDHTTKNHHPVHIPQYLLPYIFAQIHICYDSTTWIYHTLRNLGYTHNYQ